MTASVLPTRPSTSRRIGAACLLAALVGVAYVAVMLVMDPSVGDDRYSYPQSPTGFRFGQVLLAVQHVPLVLALIALARLVPTERARRSVMVGAAGMGLLAIVELINIAAADEPSDSSTATLISTLYALPTLVIGAALVVAGLAVIRGGWNVPVWIRWLPLALGVYMFVPLTPALALSADAGRVALGGWMLLYAALGIALLTESD